ncbi:MAG: glycosyl transferase, partial [Thermofilum sp. ex4484_82]
MPKVYIIIPAYNEERNINRVVNLCRRVCKANFRNFEILVIDDGSIDDTKIQAERAGAEVLVNPKNLGKGASLMHA